MERTERSKIFEAEVEIAKAIAEAKIKTADNVFLSLAAMFECVASITASAKKLHNESSATEESIKL